MLVILGVFFTFQDCFDYLGDFRGILVILEACILINKKEKRKKKFRGYFGCFRGLILFLGVFWSSWRFWGILVIFYVSGLFWGF